MVYYALASDILDFHKNNISLGAFAASEFDVVFSGYQLH
jgi:hypothetical protein